MLSSLRKLSSQSSAELIRNIIFFIAFYLYLWLVVETRLIYHGGGIIASFPIFFRGWAFFCEFLSYPGGLVEYISAFLSQFLYIGWAGAIVVTVQAWLICVCSGYFIKAINARRLLFVRFIPPIILLMTYTRYRYFFTTMMALLTALFFVCLYLKVKSKSRLSGVVVFLVMSVVVYTIAGGAHLVFAVLCGVYELFWRRRWRISLVYFLLAVVIPYVEGVLIFNVDIVNAFDNLLPLAWGITYYEPYKEVLIMLYVLYLFLPFTALVSGLWRILFVKQVKTKPHKSKKQKSISNKLAAALVKCCSCAFVKSLVLFAVFGTTAFFFYDSRIKTLFEVDYYSYHKMWPQVLASARGYPQNHLVVHAVNRALYHTSRLGYDMFCWPQYRDALLLTSQEYDYAYWQRIDIVLFKYNF